MRWLTRIVAALAVALVLLALALHWFIVPRIDHFRPQLQAMAERALGAPVRIGALRAVSTGLVPSVSLHDVEIQDAQGRVGLRVPRVLAAFSVLSLARGGLEQLVIERPQMDVRRTGDGRILVAGIDMSGDAAGHTGAADWFFSQSEFLVQDGQLRWLDEQRGAAPVTLQKVQVLMRNGRHRHQMRLDATPDAPWGAPFTLMGQFRQPLLSRHAGQWRHWDGQLFAWFERANVSRLRQYVDLQSDWNVDVRRGHGALRVWADVRQGQLTSATADVALAGVEVALGPDLAPLAFAQLSGRVGWQASRSAQGSARFYTEGLQFTDGDGLHWPGGNVRLTLRDTGSQQDGGELVADRLDLQALAKISRSLPLPDALRQPLAAHQVQGQVQRLDARWDGPLARPGDWRHWRVQASVADLSLTAAPDLRADGAARTPGLPGIEGAQLHLTATPQGGEASLHMRHGALHWPGLFEDPRLPLHHLQLRSHWQVAADGHIQVSVDELKLANDDASGSFSATWRTRPDAPDGERLPGVLKLQGSLSRANGARVHRYLPLAVPEQARHYVRDAVRQGRAHDVQVHVEGDVRHITDAAPPPGTVFRIAGRVSDVTLAYVPPALQPSGQPAWPALLGVSGQLVFEHASMRVRQASAAVQGHAGWRFDQIEAGIDDLTAPRVRVSARGQGALATALDIVRASPVADFTAHALDSARATGQATLQLGLDLPIDRIEQSRAEGHVQLSGNDLHLGPHAPPLTQARGQVRFSETGFALHQVQARALGGDAHIEGGMGLDPLPQQSGDAAGSAARPRDAQPPVPSAPVRLRVRGVATAEGLRQMTRWPPLPGVARLASGSARYQADLALGMGDADVRVRSDLQGLALHLPAPLHKAASVARPLQFEMRPLAQGQDLIALQLAASADGASPALALRYERDTRSATARVLRGALALGPQAGALALPTRGVSAQVQWPQLAVQPWVDALRSVFGDSADADSGGADPDAVAQADAYLPDRWQLRADTVHLGRPRLRALHAVHAQGTRQDSPQGRRWLADVQSRELAGHIEYRQPLADSDPGHVRARLARLSLGEADDSADAASAAAPEPDDMLPDAMPALDVVVDDFALGARRLGRLQLQANHRSRADGGDWQLQTLSLDLPGAHLAASGRWSIGPEFGAARPRARTTLDFRLDIRSAGDALTGLGMPGVIAHGRGHMAGQLTWRGAPHALHYPSLDGQLRLALGAGQFLKVEPGMAKLLGVLSLQSLPRRLTLDFRDLFSAGFAFDRIDGDIQLQRGEASTHNLHMQGASALVVMQGSADLLRQTQDLRVIVTPAIDAGNAALVAAAVNPVVGLGAFVAQLALQKPLSRAATRQFHITGRWDAPQVLPLSGAEAGQPASGAPASGESAGHAP